MTPRPPIVYLIHRRADKPAARVLAEALRTTWGIDVWFDEWEIEGGDDYVHRMELGLRKADGAITWLSPTGWGDQSWARAEATVVQRRMLEEGLFVVPVTSGPCPDTPEFLKALHAFPPDPGQVATAVLRAAGHLGSGAPPLGSLPVAPRPLRLELGLRREGDQVHLTFEGHVHQALLSAASAAELRAASRPPGPTRDGAPGLFLDALDGVSDRLLAVLGPLAPVLRAALDPRLRNHEAALTITGEDEGLLSLPWEAVRLAGGEPLGVLPRVVVARRPPTPPLHTVPVPGPLRVLAALAAPGEDLDLERESEVLTTAFEGTQHDDARVVFASESLATTEAIREAARAPFHVLHLSAHGGPTGLLLEGPSGEPIAVDGPALARLLGELQHRPLMVFLSACRSAVPDGGVHLARALLDAGVPVVVAMSNLVGDGYATELAHHVYRELAGAVEPAVARAVANARAAVERARREHAARGHAFRAPTPEYATPVVYVAGDALSPLYDASVPRSSPPPAPDLVGVQGLALRPVGYVVGRRVARREVRAALTRYGCGGVVLVGQGGIGKSSLAAEVARGLRADGWVVAVCVGALSEQGLLEAVRRGFSDAGRPATAPADLAALRPLLQRERLLLLLDNFEDNFERADDALPMAGPRGAFPVAAAVTHLLEELVPAAASGRGTLLLTSRYPVRHAGLEERGDLGELKAHQVARMVWRLPGLLAVDPARRSELLASLGGHPRVLEFADALLREAQGDAHSHVSELVEHIRARRSLPGEAAAAARALAAEDVLLDALLGRLTADERAALIAVSVFRVPVPEAALTAVVPEWTPAVRDRLRRLTLLAPGGVFLDPTDPWTPFVPSWMVHRWTAEELRDRVTAEEAEALRTAHAGAAAWWLRVSPRPWAWGWEALDHWLAARAWDDAHALGQSMHRFAAARSASDALAVADHLAAGLPDADARGVGWRVETLDALAALGFRPRAMALADRTAADLRARLELDPADSFLLRSLSVAFERSGDLEREGGNAREARRHYERSLELRREFARADPSGADPQRDVSVSLEKLADVCVILGGTEEAKGYYEASLDLRQRLHQKWPECYDFRRDLSISYERLADLHRAGGEGTEAQRLYEASLTIRVALLSAEPDRTDFRRDLSTSHERCGDFHLSRGDRREALEHYEASISLRHALVFAEADRADYKRELSVAQEKLGDAWSSFGNAREARRLYGESIGVRQALARGEPDRADYQRDLLVAHIKVGDLDLLRNDREEARQHFEAALDLAKKLLQFEPERADYQRSHAISLAKIGSVQSAGLHYDEAKRCYEASLDIFSKLARSEPPRANHQRDLAFAYGHLGDIHRALGDAPEAKRLYEAGLDISLTLASAEPDRADYQRDLAASFESIGAVDPGDPRWLDQAVAIRVAVFQREPGNALLARECAICLLQVGEARQDAEAFNQGGHLLVELRRRGALEAQYWPMADELLRQLGETPPQ